MGHRNTQFTGHMIDLETYPQGHNHRHPKPCVFYGSVTSYPQPNIHHPVPIIGDSPNFYHHRQLPEHRSGNLYGMPQYEAIQPQRPGINLDLSVSAPSGHYNPYLEAFPYDSYSRNMSYMDGVRGSYKRNNCEGAPANYQYHNASAESSSFVAPITSIPAESDVISMDAAAFVPPEYGRNDPTPGVESGPQQTTRAIPDFHVSNASHAIQGSYVSSPVLFPGNPWFDMHIGANNGDIGTFSWAQGPDLPFVRASANGASVDTGNRGMQAYQLTSSNQRSNSFPHTLCPPPPIPRVHSTPHHPPQLVQGARGYNVNFPPQVSICSPRFSTINASRNGINPFPDVIDARPTFIAPVLPTGFRYLQPHRRENILGSNARHHSLPYLRVLPEDEVAVLEIPGYHEAGNSSDHHIDMRLDIDHMSYEELLALGEQIGSVGTGLHEDFIQKNLKGRTFTSGYCVDLEETPSTDERVNFCVICQTEYVDGETIGNLDCEHEYHHQCIKTWLLLKNTCPICKSTALHEKGKDK